MFFNKQNEFGDLHWSQNLPDMVYDVFELNTNVIYLSFGLLKIVHILDNGFFWICERFSSFLQSLILIFRNCKLFLVLLTKSIFMRKVLFLLEVRSVEKMLWFWRGPEKVPMIRRQRQFYNVFVVFIKMVDS